MAARLPGPYLPAWLLVPAAYKGKPFSIFETGGTTGMPKQRIGWEDYKTDYSEFSEKLKDEHFPRGGAWLHAGADQVLRSLRPITHREPSHPHPPTNAQSSRCGSAILLPPPSRDRLRR